MAFSLLGCHSLSVHCALEFHPDKVGYLYHMQLCIYFFITVFSLSSYPQFISWETQNISYQSLKTTAGEVGSLVNNMTKKERLVAQGIPIPTHMSNLDDKTCRQKGKEQFFETHLESLKLKQCKKITLVIYFCCDQ